MITHIEGLQHVRQVVDGERGFQRLIRAERRVADHGSEEGEPLRNIRSDPFDVIYAEARAAICSFRPTNASPSPKKLPNSV